MNLKSHKRMTKIKTKLRGGPFGGATIYLWHPQSGTLPFAGGRYVYFNSRQLVPTLEWEKI